MTKETTPEPAVIVDHVTKSFKIPLEASSGLKQKLVNVLKGRKGYRELTPLKDISLTVNKGDFFGIIGRNGSGKSTLLKTIAGIYTPDSGNVHINGKLVPFIELGVGFNPELTGKENVYLNGALLGYSRKEMEDMYDEIVDFAELHDFMEERLKNYSSGMQVRLAFSIAIQAKGDVLLLDEVLAVGDEAFQRKCFNYFAQLKREKKTVILVTHSMDSVQQFCNKVALIDKGHKLVIGNPLEIAQIYRELNFDEGTTSGSAVTAPRNKYYTITTDFKKNNKFLTFDFTLEPLQKVDDDLVMTFVISKSSGEVVYRFTSDEKIKEKIDFNATNRFKITLENIFPDDLFSVQIAVKKLDRTRNYALFDNIMTFELSNGIGREFWRPVEEYTLN